MAIANGNPLLSTSRASDTSPTLQLHPLVLLTISDCITRHTLRKQSGPVAGAILGQQNGQEITMEVAFQAKLRENEQGEVVLDDEWFSKRLEDCKLHNFSVPPEVHGLLKTREANAQQLKTYTNNLRSTSSAGSHLAQLRAHSQSTFPSTTAFQSSTLNHPFFSYSILRMRPRTPLQPASCHSPSMSQYTRAYRAGLMTRLWRWMVPLSPKH